MRIDSVNPRDLVVLNAKLSSESLRELLACPGIPNRAAVDRHLRRVAAHPNTRAVRGPSGLTALYYNTLNPAAPPPETIWLSLVSTTSFGDTLLSLTRHARRLFSDWCAAGPRRVACLSLAENEKAHKWMRLIGMKKRDEKTLETGATFFIFVWEPNYYVR